METLDKVFDVQVLFGNRDDEFAATLARAVTEKMD
jgi:hypothetical protein